MAIQQCVAPGNTPTPEPSKADERLVRKLEQFPHLPDDAFVGIKVVCAVRDRSPSSTQRDVKAGRLAPPVKIGPNAVRWRVGDVRRSLEGAMPDQNLCAISPEDSDHLGHNGGSPLDSSTEPDVPLLIKNGIKEGGKENGK